MKTHSALRNVNSVEETLLPVLGMDASGNIITMTDKPEWYKDRFGSAGRIKKEFPNKFYSLASVQNTTLYMTDDEQVDTNVTFGATEQAIRRGDSLVLFDRSGALYERYDAQQLAALGYTVRTLDLEDPEKSDVVFPLGAYLEMCAESFGDFRTPYESTFRLTNRIELNEYAMLLTRSFISLFVTGANEAFINSTKYISEFLFGALLHQRSKQKYATTQEEKHDAELEANLIQHHAGTERVHLIRGAGTLAKRLSPLIFHLENAHRYCDHQELSAANYVAKTVLDLIFGGTSIYNKYIFQSDNRDVNFLDPFGLSHGEKTAIIIKAAPEKMVDKRGQIFVPFIFIFLTKLVELAEVQHCILMGNSLLYEVDEDEEISWPPDFYIDNTDAYIQTGKKNIRISSLDKTGAALAQRTDGDGNVLVRCFIPQVSVIATDLPYELNYGCYGKNFVNNIDTIITAPYNRAEPVLFTNKEKWCREVKEKRILSPQVRMSFFFGIPKAYEQIAEMSRTINNTSSYSIENENDYLNVRLENDFNAIMISGVKEENIPLWEKFLLAARVYELDPNVLKAACQPQNIILYAGQSSEEQHTTKKTVKRNKYQREIFIVYDIEPLILRTVPITMYPTREEVLNSLNQECVLVEKKERAR